jgi:enoyl-CoA hydratase/carnithine racemase
VPELETLLYEEANGVAWVTLNRPDKLNAFNEVMQRELESVWKGLRTNDDVRCAVLTGAGEKAFCTGIDRSEVPAEHSDYTYDPFAYDDPGEFIGPKSCGLWKPVIAAVNGMACGGAFYMLGEVEFIIAAEHATFFDPHTTFGQAAVFEPIAMGQRMPLGEIMRLSLLGSYERMSAQRAFQIGLVSEVVAGGELHETTKWAAETIASQPARAVQGTVRSVWASRQLSPHQAVAMAPYLLEAGNKAEGLVEGQAAFASGKRITPKIR